jgi:hypothetical protein
MTPLDDLHAAMTAAPDDDAARLRWYGALAAAELVLLLEREVTGTDIAPRVLDLTEGRFVLAFDAEEKLAAFAAEPVPYVALPGRVIALSLAGQGIGLAVNAGAPSAMFLGPEALDWLVATLAGTPEADAAPGPEAILPPGAVPDAVQAALARVVATAPVAGAWLVTAVHPGGRRSLLLMVEGGAGAEDGIARAVREGLVFSGVEAGAVDVAFAPAGAPVLAAFARVGRHLAPAPAAAPAAPRAPGTDPSRPPKLR